MNSELKTILRASTQGALSLFCVVATLLLVGCGNKPSPSSSARTERAMGGGDVAHKMSQGTKLLMDSVQNPPAPFHFSYKAEKNINPKFPQDEKAKPELGPVEVEADVSADELSFKSTRGKKSTESKAKKSDQLGWPMAQLELTGSLLDPAIALAFAGAVARPAGSDTVGGVGTDKYEFDTATATGGAKAGMEMAMGMLGGKVKFRAVKGAAWVDKATGRMVKFNIDSELSDKAGNSWKEHDELLVTPK